MVSIEHICTEKYKEGYEYASLLSPYIDANLLKTGHVFDLKNDTYKPSGVYFSKICYDIYDLNFRDNCNPAADESVRMMTPEWYQFLKNDWESEMPSYTCRSLLFAKIDKDALGSFTKDSMKKYMVVNNTYDKRVDWANYAKDNQWKGIHAIDGIFPGFPWDVETVVVWDTSALREVQVLGPAKDKIFEYVLFS